MKSNIKKSQVLRPHLALTLGDPAGIGPEVILKAVADQTINNSYDLTIIGSRSVLEETYFSLRQSGINVADPENLPIIDIPLDHPMIKGVGNGVSGAASFNYMIEAINRTLAGEFQGIVTGPIAKSAWKAAGYNYPGQTELLAEKSGIKKYGMLFVARSPHSNWMLRTILATTHIPLSQVATTLNPELLTTKLELLIDCLNQYFGITHPQIAVAGINPHSGENGQLGKEEQNWLNSWIEQQNQTRSNLTLIGPIPPDTMWVKPGQVWYGLAPKETGYDGYLAMYHDQGLIPVKLMAFDLAVNTTIGLPFIRTSPDHGTAFDIAGQGIARDNSMKAALQLAAELATQKLS